MCDLGKNHETNPDWLPSYLLAIEEAANKYEGGLERIDVLGISRGHSALMASCQKTTSNLHIGLAARFNHLLVGWGLHLVTPGGFHRQESAKWFARNE